MEWLLVLTFILQVYARINIFNYIKEKLGRVILTEVRNLERQRTKQANSLDAVKLDKFTCIVLLHII